MLLSFSHENMEQRELFYTLKTAFALAEETINETKIPAIYSIHKDGICLYVGQSKNVASRLATHIKGAYSKADKIYIYPIVDHGFSGFWDFCDKTQKNVLVNNEIALMNHLKPTENKLCDYSKKIKHDYVADNILDYINGEDSSPASFCISMEEDSIVICCGYIEENYCVLRNEYFSNVIQDDLHQTHYFKHTFMGYKLSIPKEDK